MEKKTGRRAVLRFLGRDVPLAYGAEEAARLLPHPLIFKEVKEDIDRLKRTTTGRHSLADLISDLFFSSRQVSDVVPSTYHPLISASIQLTTGAKTLSMDYYVMQQIKHLCEEQAFRVESERWQVSGGNSRVLIGGARANEDVKNLLGDIPDLTKGEKPQSIISTAEGTIHLPYAIACADPGPTVTSMQCGVETLEPEWIIVANDGQRRAAEPMQRGGELAEDYLLVTKIPADKVGTSTTVFSGVHGTGTRAAAMILAGIEHSDLTRLVNQLRQARTPYFQAIFHATQLQTVDGNDVAQEVRCVFEGCPPIALHPV